MHDNNKTTLEDNVHAVLAHSYVSYFVSFLIGLFLHFLYPIKVYQHELVAPFGFAILFISTLLIIWAQRTSRTLEHGTISKESFCRGPYCYSRMPTHWGLFFMMIGFGLMINSLFVILLTLVFFIFTKITFIRKEEALLLQKYGAAYREYKSLVKF